jgi:2-oxoglutarate ferredoxin oxidoreductase subunit alpha
MAYGTTHWAIVESRDQLRNEAQLDTSYLRLRAFPFTSEVGEFIDRCDRVYLVEQNRDAQMMSLLRMECTPAQLAKLRSVLHFEGLPLDGRSVTTDILKQEEERGVR